MKSAHRLALVVLVELPSLATCHFVTPPGDPVAAAAATVVHASARFSVLAPALLRLEYSYDGTFEDRQTMVVWNRRTNVPPFTHSVLPNGTLLLETSALVLSYDSGPAATAFEDRLRVQICLTPRCGRRAGRTRAICLALGVLTTASELTASRI